MVQKTAKKIRRVDILHKSALETNEENSVRKKKKPSLPPRNDHEFLDILDAVYVRNPILSYNLHMQALTGLRYSDASWLMFDDFFQHKQWVDRFTVIQQKIFNMQMGRLAKKGVPEKEAVSIATQKAQVTIFVNDEIKTLVEKCRLFNANSPYLFANKNPKSQGYAMDIRNAEYHLRHVEKELALNFPLRTHSFRKLFAVKLIQQGATIEKIRDLLGQKSLESTNKYLSTLDQTLLTLVDNLHYESTQ